MMKKIRRGNLTIPEARKYTVYNDGELAFCREVNELFQADFFPNQLEIYVIALVLEGQITISINGKTYEGHKNDLLICQPNSIIEKREHSPDFQGRFVFVSMDYVRRVLPFAENIWEVKLQFENHPLCHLQPEESATFCQYYELLCSKVQLPQPAQKKVIDTLALAFIYDMNVALSRTIQSRLRPFTSGESLFRRFMEMLDSSYPKQRSVTYYADRLNVTPKYLSFVCKQIFGERPSTIIDDYVMRDVDYLLRHTQKSIKEIACELEFPNLSFFGKYVKKHRGVSPKTYREQMVKFETVAR